MAVRSLIWPGATAVAAAKKYNNVYVGYGIQYEAKAYTPPMPPLLQGEWSAVAEGEEGEDAGFALLEQEDAKVDPTPPVAEGEGEEEEG